VSIGSSPARLTRAIAVAFLVPAAALLCAAAVILFLGHDPMRALSALFRGAFGSAAGWTVSLQKSAPLLLCGVAVCVAFRAGVWNIGAEGQLYAGALAATAIATRWVGDDASVAWALPITAACGGLGGGILAAIAAWLRFRRGVNEVIATILLNFVAIQLVAWAVLGPLAETSGAYPQSDALPAGTRLPSALRLHLGIPLAIGFALVAEAVLRTTPLGFRFRAVGADPRGAARLGISPARMGAAALVLSGLLAGLAGAFEVMGVTGRLFAGLSPGTGYTAIAVALLARLSPGAAIASALLFGGIEAGAASMQRNAAVPADIAYVVQGVVVLFSALGAVAIPRGTR
jgi:simple sugar transport system permease protein